MAGDYWRFNESWVVLCSEASFEKWGLLLPPLLLQAQSKMARNSPVSRWCFTINNYTEEDSAAVGALAADPNTKYLISGKEVGENGTPHLQGFLILHRTQRFTWVRNKLPRAHIEKTRASSEAARDYCKKDGNFIEYGVFPERQGRRTDLENAIDWADGYIVENGTAPTSPDVAVAQPVIYIRYPRFQRALQFRAPSPQFQLGTPSAWQQVLEEHLNGPADDRQVLFYVDEEGGKGKSWFQRYYLTKHPHDAQVLTIGKRDDLAYAVKTTTKVFMFNVPRQGMEFLQYTILEQLKDRMVFSPKYQSETKLFSHNVHVVVFSNEYPDHNKMSADRYVIRDF